MWESSEVAVVLGRSSQIAREANVDACRADNIPILRRCSGGCAVVIGPGCLMYSVLLSYERRPRLAAAGGNIVKRRRSFDPFHATAENV